jgi:hypothetical protein
MLESSWWKEVFWKLEDSDPTFASIFGASKRLRYARRAAKPDFSDSKQSDQVLYRPANTSAKMARFRL